MLFMLRRNVYRTVILTQKRVNIFVSKTDFRIINLLMDKIENPFLVTLRLPVKNSPLLLKIVMIMHISCLFLPWLTEFSILIKILLVFLVMMSYCFYLYKYQFYAEGKRVTELILSYDDNWQVKKENDAVHDACLGSSLFVHPWLTIISLAYENRREHFIFTPEILDADLFRRLRVRLRFQVSE
jgi:membrane-bound toxin of toxin-antitoxin system